MSAPAARFAPASRRSARLGCMNRSSMATAFRSSRAGARCGSRSATAMIDGVQNVYGLQAAIAQRPHKRTVFESDSLHRWCRPLSASAHATQTAARSVARRSKVHCLQVVATFPNGERLLASRRDRLQAAECSLPLRRVPRLGEGQNDPPGTGPLSDADGGNANGGKDGRPYCQKQADCDCRQHILPRSNDHPTWFGAQAPIEQSVNVVRRLRSAMAASGLWDLHVGVGWSSQT
jgi:hypothetical protein